MDVDLVYKNYVERLELFKGFGCEIDKSIDFILATAAPLTGKILEIGTGKGFATLALARAGCHFTSVDISDEQQEHARLLLAYFNLEENVNFVVEDSSILSFPDESFNSIISVNTVHHLNEPFVVLGEMMRVLSSGGKIVLCDFTIKGFKVIDHIHRRVGKIHPPGRKNLKKIKEYIDEIYIKNELHTDGIEDVLVIWDTRY